MDEIRIDINSKESLLKCYRNELIPENPTVAKYGIEGLLEYRINKNKRHPDSALTHSKTSWIAKELYGNVPDSQDTIFNCWSILKIYDAIYRNSKLLRDSESILLDIKNGVKIVSQKHQYEFDLLAERHHCIANFMPAPRGFNGYRNHHGKGEYSQDNDFPDVYYRRAKVEFTSMYDWINDNMKRFSLELFLKKITPWENGKANFESMVEKPTIDQIYEIVKGMNRLLSERAESLIERKPKNI